MLTPRHGCVETSPSRFVLHFMRRQYLNSFRLIVIAVACVCLFGVSAASAQNISIVTGNGQLICTNCLNFPNFQFQAMKVLVTDNSGNPLSGQTVNWSVSGSGAPLCLSSFNGNCLSNNSTQTGADGT
jgi:hypothetical protein